MPNDALWLLVSYAYVTLVIAAGTLARSGGRRSPDVTRKIIHVGVATWIIPTTIFFTNPLIASIPPLSFIGLNLLSWRFKLVAAMEEGDRNPGTIYFPIAFVLLTLLFWPGAWSRAMGGGDSGAADHLWGRLPVAAGIMAMGWGDAAASIVGRRAQTLRYAVPGGGTRSLAGSAACALFATAGILVAGALLGVASGASLSASVAATAPAAVLAALGASVAEAWTPWGLDNLTVPLVAASIMRWLAAHPPGPALGV